jgi:transposase
MPIKRKIEVKLTEKEDAIVYAEKTLGRNETIQKKAKVIYFASKGAESIKELHETTNINRDFISRTINRYEKIGIECIYECKRGIKVSKLDKIEAELLKDFEASPPCSIPEAVSYIKEHYGIEITNTPVRYWLRKRGFVISSQEQFQQKQI